MYTVQLGVRFVRACHLALVGGSVEPVNIYKLERFWPHGAQRLPGITSYSYIILVTVDLS